MSSSVPGFAPWQTSGRMTQHSGVSAYVPVQTRNPFIAQYGLPPPPMYVPQPLAHGQNSVPQHVSSTPISGASAARKKTEWPPDVKEYVQRCFANENKIDGVEKVDVEARLKNIITEAAQTDQLTSLNWKEMPLPQQMIQDERRRAILAPQFSPSYPLQAPISMPLGNSHFTQSPTVRKRKSSEMQNGIDDNVQPPWRNGNKASKSLEDRVTPAQIPEKRLKLDQGKSMSKSNAALEQRKRRFEGMREGSNSPRKTTSTQTSTTPAEPIGPVVGTSQKLEKNYFRLTSAPNPADVRPLPILRQTLELLKKKWRTDNNYVYICDQFKSLRQDLTVQHIKNDFTTSVYEIHARIALEKGDLGEYNQCQTQLRALYKQNLGGHPSEFMAYRILYLIHTCNRTDMNDVLSDLTPADKNEKAVQHALNVRSALALGNYHQFFKLYLTVPNMGGYLMDMFVERERLAAMARICRSYKPDVRLRFITEELAFESDEDTARFILDHEAGSLLSEKEDQVHLLTSKAGSLFEDARQAAFRHVDIKGQI